MGSFFDNLKHTGVTDSSGNTTYYPTDAEATATASRQIPSSEAILGPDVLNPNPNAPSLPKVNAPTLTNKGTVLSLLLNAGLGAAAGAGQRTFGAGFASAVGMDEFRKKQAEERIAADQEARLREQALQRGPGTLRLQGLTADSIQAETNLRNAQALELAGRQHEPRSLNEVDLAMLAASDGPEAEQAQRALVNLGKGPHADKLPTSYDTLVLASELEDNPITKAKYDAAISHIERFRARPTKTESEADQDRITERDTKLVTAQAIAANGGDEPKALAFLVRTLANADANKLSRHEREVTAGAIMTLRHKPNPLADAINAALEKAQQQTGK